MKYSRGTCEACGQRRVRCQVCNACLQCHDLAATFVVKKAGKIIRASTRALIDRRQTSVQTVP